MSSSHIPRYDIVDIDIQYRVRVDHELYNFSFDYLGPTHRFR